MTLSSTKPRVRFAPSPTGELHIGGLRTALYNWLFARKEQGAFILRIEDTDQARLIPGAEDRLLKLLKTFGLQYDEGPDIGGPHGPYRQSGRLGLYQEQAELLVSSGGAYYCTCTSERLDRLRQEQQGRGEAPRYDGLCRNQYKSKPSESSVIRLRLPAEGTLIVTDLLRGELRFDSRTLDDHILLKADEFPTYHLASVVDDHLMEISHVIRGEEWLPSLPKHIALFKAFGWKAPAFVHLPLILGSNREKLSKRHGAASAQSFLDEGFLPEAIVNFIALLGWHQEGDREIFTLEELVEAFSLERLQKAPAVFDLTKLEWMNGKLIRSMALGELEKRSRSFLEQELLPEFRKKLPEALGLVRERARKLNELPQLLSFLTRRYQIDPSLLPYKSTSGVETQATLEFSANLLRSYNGPWAAKELESAWRRAIGERGMATGVVLWPLRVALTGLRASPGTYEVLELLGKKIALERVREAIRLLEQNNPRVGKA